ncbi:conserved hypothetical protein [Verticillium alfalfae VaMs.102]|uniref:Uncharacterized protein n=1 Tax=Verticillium alfalfae (strain VaMs.102 / ATCC MYA-4576 / FGSC 10136) TaxID=526221 RepID=C9SWB8_VERA1|nr:conserved hypothetical protein [Verticillium alfalfae VaMs.102]EEY23083.1 conserved hypothetical protein [Verticillium alfalfae VaMs.102]
MSNYYNPPPNQGYGAGPSAGAGAQNLQFYPSSYGPGVQGQGNPQQASYGYGAQPGGQFGGAGSPGFGGGFGAAQVCRDAWASRAVCAPAGSPPFRPRVRRRAAAAGGAGRQLQAHPDKDPRRPQPLPPHRPAHHGRLGPRRPHPAMFVAIRPHIWSMRPPPFDYPLALFYFGFGIHGRLQLRGGRHPWCGGGLG